MFKSLQKLFKPKSRFISVINMNDEYIKATANIANALGQNVGLNTNRPKSKKRAFVIEFKGDIMAKGAHALSQEISAILCAARPDKDEVLINLESPGGAVHSYGYAASQISRLIDAGIKTTVAVDRVAASGGYMMACVADRIISAPFAVLGSIGVVAEIPNINKLITNIGVEYKQYTAGKYKRTVGPLAPITDEGEIKFKEDLDKTHTLFKKHVSRFRPNLDIDKLATGEHWYGLEAIDLGLVDEIKTSDEWIREKMYDAELLKIVYLPDKSWGERVKGATISLFESFIYRALTIWSNIRFMQ